MANSLNWQQVAFQLGKLNMNAKFSHNTTLDVRFRGTHKENHPLWEAVTPFSSIFYAFL